MSAPCVELKQLPYYPLIPFGPALLLGGTFVLSMLSFLTVRRLARRTTALPPA